MTANIASDQASAAEDELQHTCSTAGDEVLHINCPNTRARPHNVFDGLFDSCCGQDIDDGFDVTPLLLPYEVLQHVPFMADEPP